MDYSVSYLLASSASGVESSAAGSCEPLDITVGMNIDLKEYPSQKAKSTA